jgi:hypothetical protein
MPDGAVSVAGRPKPVPDPVRLDSALIYSIAACLSGAGAIGFWVLSETQCRLRTVSTGSGIVQGGIDPNVNCPISAFPTLLLLGMVSLAAIALVAAALHRRLRHAWIVLPVGFSMAAATELSLSGVFCSWANTNSLLSPVYLSAYLLMAGGALAIVGLVRVQASSNYRGAPVRLALASTLVLAAGQQALWFASVPGPSNAMNPGLSAAGSGCVSTFSASIPGMVFGLFVVGSIVAAAAALYQRVLRLGLLAGGLTFAGFLVVILVSGVGPLTNSLSVPLGIGGIILAGWGAFSVPVRLNSGFAPSSHST